MNRVTNIDHLVVLLRQRLLEQTRAVRRGASSASDVRGEAIGLQGLLELGEADDHRLRRALIQDILAEHFGRNLINEAKFHRVVDQVTATLEEDADASLAFTRVVDEMRSLARQGD